MQKIIQQGAEAILIKEKDHLLKRRIVKGYRLPILDEKIRRLRTKRETRLLEKAFYLIPTPKVISSNDSDSIEMTFVSGKKLSESLDSLNYKEISKIIGKQIAILHDNNIIHGDLTTSNMILGLDKKLYFIDFGLGFDSNKAEDKAVDLHLIKQALEAKHFKIWESAWISILEGYKSSKTSPAVLKRLEAVEKRGRYKKSY